MNTVLLGAVKPVACVGCGRLLQWHRSLHTRILLGGLLFRLGLVAALVVLLLALFVQSVEAHRGGLVLASVVLAGIGILLTYTRASSTFVEVASSDA